MLGHLDHVWAVMNRVCIAVVEPARARLFTFERATDGGDTEGALVERADLASSQRRRRAIDAVGDPRSEAGEVGDHRDVRGPQIDEPFARMTMAALRELIDERPTQRVILCAPPRVLRRLGAAAPGLLPGELARDEVDRDLGGMSAEDLRVELATRDLLPRAAHNHH